MAVLEVAAKQGDLPLTDPVNLEDRILELCTASAKGITDDMIVKDQPSISSEKRLKALQRLLSMGKIEIVKQDSTLIYRLKASSNGTSKTKGFEREEKLIYQIIEDSGTKGIWTRDIKMMSNLPDSQIRKCLKTLESKKLVKKVKTVPSSKKIIYMLFDLVPDESLTGGVWYNQQDFDTEFVDILNMKCLQYLQKKAHVACNEHTGALLQRKASCASATEVCDYINKLEISQVKLSPSDIEPILNTLLYDGKAQQLVELDSQKGGSSTVKVYRTARLHGGPVKSAAFSRIPCGICPVIDQCTPGGSISPSTCVYIKDWLTF